MRTSILKRITGICLAAAMMMPTFFSSIPEKQNVSAAGTSYHFDFGGGGTASGYTGVSASDGYNASRGYGFFDTSKVKNVSASGSGALSDAVQFTDTAWSNTFNVDLPNGLYRIKVTLGNTTRTSVVAEDVLQIINMTGNNAADTILIPITDGQLNIMACPGKSGYAYTMSALDIEWVSADTQLPPTIWFCGDSTVCNYYPIETSAQAGWGQVFDQFVDSSKWQVRNMAARWFGTQLDAIGAAEGVQVIDLFNLFQDYCVSVGAAAADSLFIDNLHPNRQGALKLAELAASQMDLSGTSSGSTASGAEMDESMTFMLKNGSSGLYLSLESVPADGTNVVQAENTGITAGY